MQRDQQTFDAVLEELEALEQSFAVPGDTPGYEAVWTPDGVVRMWSVPRTTGVWLAECVRTHQPKTILELGTSSGYSALWMAREAAHYGGHVYTIEVALPKIAIATKAIQQLALQETVTILPGLAMEILMAWRRPIDMVFLDADKTNYRAYLALIEPWLAPGGMVVADNVLDYGHLMEDFVAYLNDSDTYDTAVHNFDHGLLVAVRRS